MRIIFCLSLLFSMSAFSGETNSVKVLDCEVINGGRQEYYITNVFKKHPFKRFSRVDGYINAKDYNDDQITVEGKFRTNWDKNKISFTVGIGGYIDRFTFTREKMQRVSVHQSYSEGYEMDCEYLLEN